MKSREEYEASIFAKRDALTAKRKKNLHMATATLSVVICLGAAAVAIPNLIDTTDETQLPSVTNAASGITENKIHSESHNEIFTFPVAYDAAHSYVEQHNFGYNDAVQDAIENESDEYVAFSGEVYFPESELAVEEEATASPVTDGKVSNIIDGEGVIEPDGIESGANVQGEKPSKKNYTTEEIVAEAKKHINDTDKIIDDKTNVTVSRNANGTTTYTAYFYTADKRITVELDGNLKLIEVKEKDNSGNGTTQIAPAYNPNT